MGKRIKAVRRALGLSQGDVAQVLGVTSITVSRWETGTQAPDDLTKRMIASVLKTTVAYLFGETSQSSSYESGLLPNATEKAVQLNVGKKTPNSTRPDPDDASDALPTRATDSAKQPYEGTPLVVGEEPVWIDIVEPAACAGPGNGYHEVTWKPIGRLPFSPVDLMGYAWHSGKMRVIRIEGSSMEPRYREGDRVLFSDDGVVSGDIAIVMWDSRLYIRGYIVTPDKMVHLRAFNKENPEIVVDPGDPRLQILGKVLAKVGIEPDKGFW